MAKTGRPKIPIDQKEFENLCAMMCTEEEVCGWFKCGEDTLRTWCKKTYGDTFSGVYKRFSAKGKISLRRMQYKSAEAGNVTMQIWLGKQYLGQHEPDQSVSIVEDMDEIRKEVYGE